MTTPSFERIDYQLRYNKHIERKLVFDVLARAMPLVGFGQHRYLGFGSMWFSDFRLAHRVLGLSSMISMERKKYEKRANFNRPYRCITVKGENSTDFLRKLEWNSPLISWLDYDGCLEQSVVEDLGLFVDDCLANSVVIVSVNAGRANYRPKASMTGSAGKRISTALGQVEALLGVGVVPPRFEPTPPAGGAAHGDVSEEQFAEFLAEALLAFLTHRVTTGSRKFGVTADGKAIPMKFLPLFNFCHKDGAEMVTVGGVVCSALAEGNPWFNDAALGMERNADNLPKHYRLDMVPLTLKEKLTLDSCLPHDEVNFMAEAKQKGIGLDDSELLKYRRYYGHFPMFFEVPI